MCDARNVYGAAVCSRLRSRARVNSGRRCTVHARVGVGERLRLAVLGLLVSTLVGSGMVTGGCAGSGDGELQINYQYRGVDAAEYVNVYLIDTFTTQLNCRSVRDQRLFQPWSAERNLPAQGVSTFLDVPAGQGWMVYAIAIAQGNEVAAACKEDIRIPAGRVVEENLVLQASPLRLQGRYEGVMNLALSDAGGFASSITAGGVLCGLIGNNATEELCQVLGQLAGVIGSNAIKAAWNFNSFDTRANGSMEFVEINGVPVGNRALVRGRFAGSIVGRNKLVVSDLNMTVNTDAYVRFLLTEVLRVDFTRYAFGIDLVLREAIGTMNLTSAEFVLADSSFNDVVDSISGYVDVQTSFFGGRGGLRRIDNINATRVSTQVR